MSSTLVDDLALFKESAALPQDMGQGAIGSSAEYTAWVDSVVKIRNRGGVPPSQVANCACKLGLTRLQLGKGTRHNMFDQLRDAC